MNNNNTRSIVFDNKNNIITIFSDDDYSCKLVFKIINRLFSDESKLYYASGLPSNISEIYEDIKQFNPYYNEGDSKRFYIRKYPKVCANITDEKSLESLIDNWVSTIYETRKIYITKKIYKNELLNCLINNASYKMKSNQVIMDYALCIIENAPEAPNHNTFVLKCRKDYLKKIYMFINYEEHALTQGIVHSIDNVKSE